MSPPTWRGRPGKERPPYEMTPGEGFSAVTTIPRAADSRRLALRALLRSIELGEVRAK